MPTAQVQCNQSRRRSGDSSDREQQKVLLVDDDPALRKAMSKRLASHGLAVTTAGCGAEAIRACKETRPDVIVLDVNMPDMDGFEACQRIKSAADVPVNFMTGERNAIISEHMPQMVKTVGGMFYLGKPCDAELLAKLITDILHDRECDSD